MRKTETPRKSNRLKVYHPEIDHTVGQIAVRKIRERSRNPLQPIDLPGPMIHHAITENA